MNLGPFAALLLCLPLTARAETPEECASVGQRTLVISPDKAPDGALAVIIIRPRQGGSGFKYTIPTSDLPKLGAMNANFDPRGRWDAVMKDDSLYSVEAAP